MIWSRDFTTRISEGVASSDKWNILQAMMLTGLKIRFREMQLKRRIHIRERAAGNTGHGSRFRPQLAENISEQ